MDVDTDDELLQRLAAGGTINYNLWPRLLAHIIARLQTIVASEYPVPVIPPPRRTQSKLPQPPPPPPPPPLPSRSDASNGASAPAAAAAAAAAAPVAGVDKENADPVAGGAAGAPPSAGPGGAAANGSAAPASASAAPPSSHADAPALPKPVLDLVDYIITTLQTSFARYPPHSIQRFAELILAPRQHYRYLAPYLHAVDRVISVTSGSNAYPLPPAVPDRAAMASLAAGVVPSVGGSGSGRGSGRGGVVAEAENGGEDALDMSATGLALAANPAGDNSLGALLTPIPWLRRRTPSAVGAEEDSGSSAAEDGASSPSSGGSTADGSDLAFSAAGSSAAGSVRGGAHPSQAAAAAAAAAASSSSASSTSLLPQPAQTPAAGASPQQLLHQQPHQQPHQQQHQQGHLPTQHRMEVRTEATETIEGPNGMGGVETVSVSVNGIPSHGAMLAAVQRQQQRGITQGELLRQEQTAGVVPVTQLARAAAARAAAANGMTGFGDRFLGGGGGRADEDDEDDEDEDEDNDMDDEEEDDTAPHDAPHDAPGPAAGSGSAASAASAGAPPAADEDTAMGGTDAEGGDRAQDAATAKTSEVGNGNGNGNGDDDDDDAIPHARGPQELGAADMGPQRAASATAAGSLRIGSAADAHPVDLRGLDVEAAVGRKASALPPGTVAAPVVPAAAAAAASAAAATAAHEGDAELGSEAPPAPPVPARAATPKREAEQLLAAAGPAKRRKEGHEEGGSGSGEDAAVAGTAAEIAHLQQQPAAVPAAAGDKPTADEPPGKEDRASSVA